MRERIIEVIQRGLDKDHASETIADAVLAEINDGFVIVQRHGSVVPGAWDQTAFGTYTAMIDAARSGRSGER